MPEPPCWQHYGGRPDSAEWIGIAISDERKVSETVDVLPDKHPFQAKYNQIAHQQGKLLGGAQPGRGKEALERGWSEPLAVCGD